MDLDRKPNILVFVLDTLRPDVLSCYPGSDGANTPHIDEIADTGLLFERAFSVGPNTEISHAGLFTGKYPSETGMVGRDSMMPEETPVIADWLRNQGYRTYGISGPGKIRSDLGFDRGFDEYIEPYYETLEPELSIEYLWQAVTNETVGLDFLRTLRNGPDDITNFKLRMIEGELKQTDNQPLFGFINFLTPHTPYDPPRPFKERATSSLNRPEWFLLEWVYTLIGRDLETLNRDDVRSGRVFRAARGKGQPYHADRDWLTDDELDVLWQWYCAEVEYLDHQIGQFYRSIENIADNTIIILTSDHGEHFGEHGLLYHGDFLYDETLHVPLVLSGPGVPKNRRRSDLISLVDLFPAISDLLDIQLSADVSGQSPFSSRTRKAVYAEYGKRDMSESKKASYLRSDQLTDYSFGRKCIRTPDYKLVLRSDELQSLYQLPEETETSDPEIIESLQEKLVDTLGTEFLTANSAVNEVNRAVKKNLQQLGYIQESHYD